MEQLTNKFLEHKNSIVVEDSPVTPIVDNTNDIVTELQKVINLNLEFINEKICCQCHCKVVDPIKIQYENTLLDGLNNEQISKIKNEINKLSDHLMIDYFSYKNGELTFWFIIKC